MLFISSLMLSFCLNKSKAVAFATAFDFTYSFPCTDISTAGQQQGLIRNGTRSGLLYECEKIIEIKKPKFLLMENVKT